MPLKNEILVRPAQFFGGDGKQPFLLPQRRKEGRQPTGASPQEWTPSITVSGPSGSLVLSLRVVVSVVGSSLPGGAIRATEGPRTGRCEFLPALMRRVAFTPAGTDHWFPGSAVASPGGLLDDLTKHLLEHVGRFVQGRCLAPQQFNRFLHPPLASRKRSMTTSSPARRPAIDMAQKILSR